MVYCDQDMCESKLGRLMQAFRADRPDEWTMDEFIGMAEQMHKEIDALRKSEKDAERYRWLRDCNWNESNLCVVTEPKVSVKLGTDCPSSDRLDAAIDEAMQCSK